MVKRFASNLFLLIMSVILTLVFAEVALRIAHIGYPSLGGKLAIFTWDPYTGVGLRPGASGWAHTEADVFVSINQGGMHDREHNLQKPPNTYRIAVLGDSFTEAFQVPVDKAFWSVLERKLDGCPALGGKKVETLNFGVSGFGTAQELEMLRHRAWQYSPDLVLLAFFTGNDIQNNNRILQQDPYRPYYIEKDGKLALDNSFLSEPGFRSRFDKAHLFLSWAVAHSRVLQVMAAAKNYWSSKNIDGVKPTEMGLDDAIYHAPTDPVWQDAWHVTDDLLISMNNEVVTHGAKFLVVTLSSGIQVDPDPTQRQQLMKRLGVSDLFYPDYRVRDVAMREHIPVETLAPIFQQYAIEHGTQLHGFRGSRQGHWNEAGHELAGELIANKVCTEVLPSKPAGTLIPNVAHNSGVGLTDSQPITNKAN
jgi:hypothetical protein